jgi:hypothetical protein
MDAQVTGARARAVVLFSGGLDSRLTAEVLHRAGVQVVLLRHGSVFSPAGDSDASALPYPLVVRDISREMVELVKNPRYGLGRNANPCLDCKQMMYGMAWAEAQRQGADFVATGEVLGQRPMSQYRDAFRRMEKGAHVEGLVVRPLCGKLLPPTIPEQRGLIDRQALLDISGRSRKCQLELAAQWGITGFSAPAGGCKLTDPQFAGRILRLARDGTLTVETARAVCHGRMFDLGNTVLLLVGRHHEDNTVLLADAPEASLVLELRGRPGPVACFLGQPSAEQLQDAKRLVIRYSRFRDLDIGQVREVGLEQMRREWRERHGDGRGALP